MSFPKAAEDGAPPFTAHLGLTAVLCLLIMITGMHSGPGPGPGSPAGQLSEPPPATAPAPPPPLLVNAAHPLHASYRPADLRPAGTVQLAAEAAEAFGRMSLAAAQSGVTITTTSGYRSYEEQAQLHTDYAHLYGEARARELSAPPGMSEHQTGLAVDIGSLDGACPLQECFAGTPAGAWAAAEAWRFGFIVRYPQGRSAETGYAYEPWHLRYVGTGHAARMRAAGEPVLENFLAAGT